eukprot:Colp12_sorted_trinity150504_noHs@22860
MKSVLAILVVCLMGSALALPAFDEFNSWKQNFAKAYKTVQEEAHRASIFFSNLEKILTHNAGNHTYKLALNQFADMTFDEFKGYLTAFPQYKRTPGSTYLAAENVELPTSIDWRTKGYVTAVKNQGQCGSCWTFSATGSLEGQHFKKTGNLVSLSEQQLVDCATSAYGNEGCNGGLMDNAFTYIKKVGGIEQESAYPYTAKDGTCKFDKTKVAATVTGYVDIPEGSESGLLNAVGTVGPVSVAIDASQYSFQFYSSGVY